MKEKVIVRNEFKIAKELIKASIMCHMVRGSRNAKGTSISYLQYAS